MPSLTGQMTQALLAAAFERTVDAFGESVAYTTHGGDGAVTIQAIINRNPETLIGLTDGTASKRTAEVSIQLSDIPEPARGDLVMWDSEVWIVGNIQLEPLNGSALLTVTRRETKERAGQNYRDIG
jgi:hypothetical protein